MTHRSTVTESNMTDTTNKKQTAPFNFKIGDTVEIDTDPDDAEISHIYKCTVLQMNPNNKQLTVKLHQNGLETSYFWDEVLIHTTVVTPSSDSGQCKMRNLIASRDDTISDIKSQTEEQLNVLLQQQYMAVQLELKYQENHKREQEIRCKRLKQLLYKKDIIINNLKLETQNMDELKNEIEQKRNIITKQNHTINDMISQLENVRFERDKLKKEKDDLDAIMRKQQKQVMDRNNQLEEVILDLSNIEQELERVKIQKREVFNYYYYYRNTFKRLRDTREREEPQKLKKERIQKEQIMKEKENLRHEKEELERRIEEGEKRLLDKKEEYTVLRETTEKMEVQYKSQLQKIRIERDTLKKEKDELDIMMRTQQKQIMDRSNALEDEILYLKDVLQKEKIEREKCQTIAEAEQEKRFEYESEYARLRSDLANKEREFEDLKRDKEEIVSTVLSQVDTEQNQKEIIKKEAQIQYESLREKMKKMDVQYPEYFDQEYMTPQNYAKPKLIDVTPHPMVQELMKRFFTTIDSNEFDIIKIEALQNQMLYDKYWKERDTMKKLIGENKLNEKHLFHGTKQDHVMEFVMQEGFRKEFNQTAAYGHGTYLARDSSYSIAYSSNTDGIYRMFQCMVTCGESHQGNEGYQLKTWPKNANGLMYDSLVDDTAAPSIYVIHNDVRMYPNFVIYFRRKSDHTNANAENSLHGISDRDAGAQHHINDDTDDERKKKTENIEEKKDNEIHCQRSECLRNRILVAEQKKLIKMCNQDNKCILYSKQIMLAQFEQVIKENLVLRFKTSTIKPKKYKKKNTSNAIVIDHNDINKCYIRISEAFTSTLPTKIQENIKITDIYQYLDKWGKIYISMANNGAMLIVINYGFHNKNGDNVYCVIKSQDPEIKVNRGYEYKMDDALYTKQQLKTRFRDIRVPQNLCHETFTKQWQHKQKHLQALMQNTDIMNELISNTSWTKVPIFNDLNNVSRITLSMDQRKFVNIIRTTETHSIHDYKKGHRINASKNCSECNQYDLLPVMVFDNEYNRWMVQFMWIVKIEIEVFKRNIHVGISLKYAQHKSKWVIKATGIYLNKKDIYKRHMLISPEHMNECKCLDKISVHGINELKIGNPNQDRYDITDYKKQNQLLKDRNTILMEMVGKPENINALFAAHTFYPMVYPLQLPQATVTQYSYNEPHPMMNLQYNMCMNAQFMHNEYS